MSISTIAGQKYQTETEQKIYLPVYGLLLTNTGKASKIQRFHPNVPYTTIQVPQDVASHIHALFEICSYAGSNASENQRALQNEIRSLFPSSQPLAQRAHTEALARFSSKPPIGRQRSYEDPTHSRFPLADFTQVLNDLDADRLEGILKDFAWQAEDLEDILNYVRQNRDEQRWNRPLTEKVSSPLDEITYRIFLKAIEKKFVPIIPAIPRFCGQTRDFYANELAAAATTALCKEQTGTHFDFFLSILKKQTPSKAQEYVEQVLKAAAKNPSLIQKLQSNFPQWAKQE